MSGIITPSRIKENNRMMIYRLIYQQKRISQLDISYLLHLSRPTVTGKLNELLEEGLILRDGQISADQIGRKAAAYTIAPDYRIAIGVQLTELSVYIIALNLYGEQIAYSVYPAGFSEDEKYYEKVCRFLEEFILSVTSDRSSVLGIGIAINAVPSPDGLQILPGGPMKNKGFPVSVFSDRLGIPCRFLREAECAAAADIWTGTGLENGFFLYLSYHLDGAVIYNRSVLSGKHGRCGEIAHIPYRHNGDLCYCGRHGCLETVLSAPALLGPKEGMTVFFQKLKEKDEGHLLRWKEYLSGLAFVVSSLAPVFDCDFILGGEIAAFMSDEDLARLQELIQKQDRNSFPVDYLQIHPLPPRGIPLGAALPYIWAFLAELPEG